MVVSGEKTDLLVVGTAANRRNKVGDRCLSIVVDNKVVTESTHKKLLGVILNNSLSWKQHVESLISQLSQRAGLLQKLSYSSSKKKLKMFAAGIFYSKLEYCLPLFINTWGQDPYCETDEKSVTLSKDQVRKLQVLQNKVCRLLISRKDQEKCRVKKQDIPTVELLRMVDVLSIHQLGAFSTLVFAKKIIMTGKPLCLANQFVESNVMNTRIKTYVTLPKVSLSASREGFIYRAAKLINKLPESVWKESSVRLFKKKLYEWVKMNISVKP